MTIVQAVPVKPSATHTTSLTPQPGWIRRVCYTCGNSFYRKPSWARRYGPGKQYRDYCSQACFRDKAWSTHLGKRIICRCSRCTIPFDDGDFKRVPGQTHCAQCEREIPLGHVEIGDFIRDSGYFVRLGDSLNRDPDDKSLHFTGRPKRKRGRPRMV